MPGTTRTPKKGKPPRGWQEHFLKALAAYGNVRAAAEAASVGRRTVYGVRDRDPKFRAAWDDAIDEATDLLELEARRRALKGTARPVYQGGQKVGEIQDYSDTLLIFLLKANRPEKYRDNYDLTRLIDKGGGLGSRIAIVEVARPDGVGTNGHANGDGPSR